MTKTVCHQFEVLLAELEDSGWTSDDIRTFCSGDAWPCPTIGREFSQLVAQSGAEGVDLLARYDLHAHFNLTVNQ
jgi:hypothetical protein